MKLQIGHIVRLKKDNMSSPARTLGVVVDCYILKSQYGYMVLFEDGNYDGFSEDAEIDDFLTIEGVCDSLIHYEFVNVSRLYRDYQQGIFDYVFNLTIVQHQ